MAESWISQNDAGDGTNDYKTLKRMVIGTSSFLSTENLLVQNNSDGSQFIVRRDNSGKITSMSILADNANSSLFLGHTGSTRVTPGSNISIIGNYGSDQNGIRFQLNGSDKMTLDSSGNLGINDSSPSYKLDVNGTGRFTGAVTLDSTLAVAGDANFDSGTLFVDVSENRVGIGTNSPQNKLDVEGSVVIGASYSGSTTAPSNGLLVQRDVGIGTSRPSGILDVQGGTAPEGAGDGTDIRLNAQNGEDEEVSHNGGNIVIAPGTKSWAGNDGDVLIAVTPGGTAVGNVGVGTNIPAYKLDVNGNASFKVGGNGGNIDISTPNNDSGFSIYNNNRADIAFDDSYLRIVCSTGTGVPSDWAGIIVNTSGNVGINETSPDEKLHVDGNIKVGNSGASSQHHVDIYNDDTNNKPGYLTLYSADNTPYYLAVGNDGKLYIDTSVPTNESGTVVGTQTA